MKPFDERALKVATAASSFMPRDNGMPLRVELWRPAGLPLAERSRWAQLSEQAMPGNIFAQDWFMEPALRHCGTEWSLRLAVVRQAGGAWLGALPLTLEHSIGRCPAPSFHSWSSANQFLGTPMVRPGAEKAFWRALLARLDARPGVALGLNCANLPVTDPITLSLASLCAEQGRRLHVTESYRRPARMPWSTPADPKAAHKLDKRLDGLESRLAQALGPVDLVLHDLREDCEPWLAAFLALERAGWKGRAESALACDTATSAMFREVIRNGHRSGAVRLASLTAGERIVAMTSWFIADSHGYGFKMTFDEAWHSHAPGRLLMRKIARRLDSAAPLLFDTCIMPGAPSDPLWPDRRALGGFAVGIGGSSRRAAFDALMQVKAKWQRES
jgi:CelD/BcsL family acetyltransferase involved in cellulose biosynthesis